MTSGQNTNELFRAVRASDNGLAAFHLDMDLGTADEVTDHPGPQIAELLRTISTISPNSTGLSVIMVKPMIRGTKVDRTRE